jgi:hypothetical protein
MAGKAHQKRKAGRKADKKKAKKAKTGEGLRLVTYDCGRGLAAAAPRSWDATWPLDGGVGQPKSWSSVWPAAVWV